jgi:hypothetical protein
VHYMSFRTFTPNLRTKSMTLSGDIFMGEL